MKSRFPFLILLCFCVLYAPAFSSLYPSAPPSVQAETADPYAASVPMYRLYNLDTAEHLYTRSENERDVLIQRGWVYEGIGFFAAAEGAASHSPASSASAADSGTAQDVLPSPAGTSVVHRLYNPGSTDHHYTADENEYRVLTSSGGWNDEGVAWLSADPAWGVPMYRLFAPSLTTGAHHYTTSRYERDQLIRSGAWLDEGIACYVAAEGQPAQWSDPPRITGEYLGVEQFGRANVAEMASFRYLFRVAGETMAFSVGTEDPSYSVQNQLIRGQMYHLTTNHGQILSVEAVSDGSSAYFAPVYGTTGLRTVKNLLQTALYPVGTTLYIYGGGWNWQDNGGAVTYEPGEWAKFFASQDASYDFDTGYHSGSYYPHGEWNEYWYAGLDCSGYLGWTLRHVLADPNAPENTEDYTIQAFGFARSLSDRGYGSLSQNMQNVHPGDIVSAGRHVWMVVGSCPDGSIVLLDSTPSPSITGARGGGPALRGLGPNSHCQANQLAQQYMRTYYPAWYSRYQNTLVHPGSYETFSVNGNARFSWEVSGNGVLTDPEGYMEMNAEEILADMFK